MVDQQVQAVLQRQSEWNVGGILNPHFGNLNYLLPPTSRNFEIAVSHKVYDDNAFLWKDVISGTLTAFDVVTLRNFDLFPWLPRSPGLYHTDQAAWAREEALHYLDDRFGPAPIRRIDHAVDLLEGQKGQRPEWGDHTLVFAPQGKSSMLDGGVGCVRLKPVVIKDTPLWFMSASSTGVAHEGFPLGVPIDLHGLYRERLLREGAVRCNITGPLMFLPRPFSQLFDSVFGISIQPLYLWVRDIEPVELFDSTKRREVSVAVSFLSDYQGHPDFYASYVTFSPEVPASYEQAVTWLKNEYVERGYHGRIVTDFDQTKTVFPEAALGLRKIMGRQLQRGELEETLELMHVRGAVAEFFDELARRELLRTRGGEKRNSIFISYSHNDRDRQWVERVRVHLRSTFYDQNVNIWDDSRIPGGARWHEEIKDALAATKVAVLIVSADYLASDYIRNQELPSFLLAAESEGAVIKALIGSPCNLTGSASTLQEFQFVNPLDQPLDSMPADLREDYFKRLAREIYDLIQA